MERLPRDVMIDIFSWLPIKSVVRCKSVSKSWEALISDPSFGAIHFKRASTLASDYIITEIEMDYDLIETEEEDNETPTMKLIKRLDFPDCLERLFISPILLGSCLGYVWCSIRDMQRGETLRRTNPMHLFNPITGANILLPQFEETPLAHCLYGFGLDVSTQECKVLLVYLRKETFSMQVHTVGRDCSWRTNTVPTMLTDVTGVELMKGDIQKSLPLDFNGSIHWIVLSLVDKENSYGATRGCILSFQLDTEVFGVIPMPEPLQLMKPYFYNSMTYALQLCGECLSIIYCPEASIVDMWVMADYNISESWVKKYSIQLNCIPGSTTTIKPFGFHKNGELMLCLSNEGLVCYNTDSDKYKILMSGWAKPFPFVGSLISLKSAYGDSEVQLKWMEQSQSRSSEVEAELHSDLDHPSFFFPWPHSV